VPLHTVSAPPCPARLPRPAVPPCPASDWSVPASPASELARRPASEVSPALSASPASPAPPPWAGQTRLTAQDLNSGEHAKNCAQTVPVSPSSSQSLGFIRNSSPIRTATARARLIARFPAAVATKLAGDPECRTHPVNSALRNVAERRGFRSVRPSRSGCLVKPLSLLIFERLLGSVPSIFTLPDVRPPLCTGVTGMLDTACGP